MHTNKNSEMWALSSLTNTSIDYYQPKCQTIIRLTC